MIKIQCKIQNSVLANGNKINNDKKKNESENSKTIVMNYGFKLSRPNQNDNTQVNYVIFCAETYEDCLVWQEALSTYVI